jgi:hypothetical protein
MLKLTGFVVVLGVGYAAFHFLFGHGWLGKSACLFIWLLLASLYLPRKTRPLTQMPTTDPEEFWTDEEKKVLFGDGKRKH